MDAFRPRNHCPLPLSLHCGQRSDCAYRFRFDRQSIRLLTLAPFERWFRTISNDAEAGLEFEAPQTDIHLLECANLRHFVPALLDSIENPFLRLDMETMKVLALASLPDLAIMRNEEGVHAAFAIDGLQGFLLDQYRKIENRPNSAIQLQRMIAVAAELGLKEEDWLEPT